MSPAPKLEIHLSPTNHDTKWRPSAEIPFLKKRAEIIQRVRQFFSARNILEVDTPLMCRSAATDPFLLPIPVTYQEGKQTETLFLQTSPEFPMKRLLAAGCGPIFQICKAFRNNEVGRFHNPEFTILEWYRPNFIHHDLMDEMSDFLTTILNCKKPKRISYKTLFQQEIQLNPHTATFSELKNKLSAFNVQLIHVADQTADQEWEKTLSKDDYLNLIMTHIIEPKIGFDAPLFIYDYPTTQAALAKIRQTSEGYAIAERFEVYIKGVELANGYHELADANEQLIRFQKDVNQHKKLKRNTIPIDYHLINALKFGMPDCAGVALGIDRLIMLALEAHSIDQVQAFTIDRV